jgi:hypothetical protein
MRRQIEQRRHGCQNRKKTKLKSKNTEYVGEPTGDRRRNKPDCRPGTKQKPKRLWVYSAERQELWQERR